MTQVLAIPAQSNRELDAFIRFPLRLYHQDPFFVPPLLYERKKFFKPSNPIFQFTEVTYFLACDEEGRGFGAGHSPYQ